MTHEPMAYVAADPEQPGAAWACCLDRPEHAKDTAEALSDWVLRGANIMRVDINTAREMMLRWDEKKPTADAMLKERAK